MLKLQEWQVHASTRHPTKGKDAQHRDATRREDSCPWERERCESSVFSISLSAISALERSREFTGTSAEAVTKKSVTSSIESLMSVDASEFLNSSITVMTIARMSAQA